MSHIPKKHDLKAHAKYLKKYSSLKTTEAQDIIAHIYGFNSWVELLLSAGKPCEIRADRIPLFSRNKSSYLRFGDLLKNRNMSLALFFNRFLNPSNCLLTSIIEGKLKRIEDRQLEGIVRDFNFKKGSAADLAYVINTYENGIAGILSSPSSINRNIWLESAFFQQKVYGSFIFEDRENVSIHLNEYYSVMLFGKEIELAGKIWLQDFMLLYAKRIDKEFKELGFKPSFFFYKFQDTPIEDPSNSNAESIIVLRIVNKLKSIGGIEQISPRYPERKCIKIIFQ